MDINSEALTLALSRRLAIVHGRNQQAAMVQCAARLLQCASPENKIYILQFIAATPAERQRIVSKV